MPVVSFCCFDCFTQVISGFFSSAPCLWKQRQNCPESSFYNVIYLFFFIWIGYTLIVSVRTSSTHFCVNPMAASVWCITEHNPVSTFKAFLRPTANCPDTWCALLQFLPIIWQGQVGRLMQFAKRWAEKGPECIVEGSSSDLVFGLHMCSHQCVGSVLAVPFSEMPDSNLQWW